MKQRFCLDMSFLETPSQKWDDWVLVRRDYPKEWEYGIDPSGQIFQAGVNYGEKCPIIEPLVDRLRRENQKRGIYVVSKIRHATRWQELRKEYPIISTWIDDGAESDVNFSEAWPRYLDEASSAETILVYVEYGEILKGGLLEVGAGLASGARVLVVGTVPQLRTASRHPRMQSLDTLEDAIKLLPRLNETPTPLAR